MEKTIYDENDGLYYELRRVILAAFFKGAYCIM